MAPASKGALLRLHYHHHHHHYYYYHYYYGCKTSQRGSTEEWITVRLSQLNLNSKPTHTPNPDAFDFRRSWTTSSNLFLNVCQQARIPNYIWVLLTAIRAKMHANMLNLISFVKNYTLISLRESDFGNQYNHKITSYWSSIPQLHHNVLKSLNTTCPMKKFLFNIINNNIMWNEILAFNINRF